MSVPSRQIAFSCLATDDKGSLVAAGGQDTFDAYLWSVQTGMLLACLSGHQAPISYLEFSPSLIAEGIEIASGSWDGTVKLWDVGSCYSNTMTAEGDTLSPAVIKNNINCNHDVMAIAYNPEGNQLAVVLINGTISFFDVFTSKEVNFIEGKMDLGCAASEPDDMVNGKRISVSSKNFRSISYSLDGQYLIAGGDSKYVCLYSVIHGVLLKRFEITCNMSLAGVQEMHDRRQFLMSLAKGRSGNALEEVEEMRSILQLPGVKTNDRHSRRSWRPEVRVSCIKFSPTGDSFSCSSTEGVLLFSQLSSGMRNTSGFNFDWIFDPISGGGLDIDATPLNAKRHLSSGNYASALDIAIRLRIYNLLEEVVESIPVKNVLFLVRNMPVSHVATTFVEFLATQLTNNNTKHVGFYIYWAYCVLRVHAMTLKQGCSSALVSATSISNPTSNVSMSQMKDVNNKELGDRLKKPGVLIEKNEWSLFSGSLLKLEVAVRSINRNWFDRIDAINGTVEYLNVLRKFGNYENTAEKINSFDPEKMSMDSADEHDEDIDQDDDSVVKRKYGESFNEIIEPTVKKLKSIIDEKSNNDSNFNEEKMEI